MKDSELIRQVWELSRKILGAQYAIFLFGSRAEKTNQPLSDFDFFVKGKEAVPLRQWRLLCDAVEEIPTLYKIDLVDYTAASEDFRKVASKSAKEIINGQI